MALLVVLGLAVFLLTTDVGRPFTENAGAIVDDAMAPAATSILTGDTLDTNLWIDGIGAAGATVLIDGDSVGAVPFWTDALRAGERRVQVVGTDRRTVTDTVLVVAPGSLIEIDTDQFAGVPVPEPAAPPAAALPSATPPASQPPPAALPATTGDVRITSSPSGAAVALDGRPMGRTPVSLSGVRPGRRAVSVSQDGYETVVRQLDVRPGGQIDASIALRPRPAPSPPPTPPPATPSTADVATGIVEILVRPWGRIEIDGVTHQQETDVVYRTALAPGPHRVRVSHPQLGSDVQVVTIRAGGRSRVEFDLTDRER